MTDLDKLIEAVEGGSIAKSDLDAFIPSLGLNSDCNNALDAYRGSLDAAKALHEALLPGFRFRIDDFRAEIWYGPAGPFIGESQVNPARAWLLAILKAYREETQK